MQNHGQAVDPNLVQLADAYQIAVKRLQVHQAESAPPVPAAEKMNNHERGQETISAVTLPDTQSSGPC